MTSYTAGFLFDSWGNVALIHKLRPDWQAGKLNGIGGHIEPEDVDPWAAMRREFKEETSLDIQNWKLFCELKGSHTSDSDEEFIVYFFTARVDSLKDIQTVTDEEILLVPLRELAAGHCECVPNLAWLIPMALSVEKESASFFAVIEEYC